MCLFSRARKTHPRMTNTWYSMTLDSEPSIPTAVPGSWLYHSSWNRMFMILGQQAFRVNNWLIKVVYSNQMFTSNACLPRIRSLPTLRIIISWSLWFLSLGSFCARDRNTQPYNMNPEPCHMPREVVIPGLWLMEMISWINILITYSHDIMTPIHE